MAIATLIALTALFQDKGTANIQVTGESVLAQGRAQSRRVSVDFENASVTDVINWLTKQGYDFSASDSDLPKDARLTLHVKNQPLNDVLAAIGQSLGGHWDRQGSIYVFRKGPGSSITWNTTRDMKFPGETFVAPKMDLQWQKAMEKNAAETQKWAENFAKEAGANKEWSKAMEKNAVEMQKLGSKMALEYKTFDSKALKGMQFDTKALALQSQNIAKRMAELGRQLEKQYGPEFQKKMEELGKQLQKQFGSEFEKRMQEMNKNGTGIYVIPGTLGDSFGDAFERRKMAVLGKDGQVRLRSNPGLTFRTNRDTALNSVITLDGTQDLGKLANSLTPEQMTKHERQGYLLISDLNPAQRKMLGKMSDGAGTWVVTYSNDGKSFTIRSKRPSSEKPGTDPSSLVSSPLYL